MCVSKPDVKNQLKGCFKNKSTTLTMDDDEKRETETKAVSGHQGFVNEDDSNGRNHIEEP